MDTVAKIEPRVSAEVLALLAEVSTEVNASLDLDEVLAKIAALVKRVIDYEIFAVLLLDAKDELFIRFAIGHRKEVVENWRIPLGQGITGTAASTSKAIRVADVRDDSRYLNALETVRSELAVPLLVKGKCVGVLDIQSRQVDAFTRDEQNILTLLATRLAVAIENARLFERTRHQAETLLLLHDVSRQASEVLDLKEVLRRSAEVVKRVIDYQIFSILLYDDHERVFRHRLSVKFGQNVHERISVPWGEGIVGAAAISREPILVRDVLQDSRYLAVNPETRSELAVPLIHQNVVIGVLDLESPQVDYFSEEHVQTMSTLAANLAIAIENARLYERVARHEARMERELQSARRMQATLLPGLPKEDYGLDIAARYVPARELGGDVYDFHRYGPQELGVALGDVSGKGTDAALYGAVAIGIFRSLAARKLGPAEMLRTMNQLLGERRIDGQFMTLCFATWQRRWRRLRIANAGQSQPLLFKDGRAEKLPLVGFPLGLGENDVYDEMKLALDPGDILLFYSDGVVESTSHGSQQYGAARLANLLISHAALSANELADRILEDVEKFSGGRPAADDRTLVVLKVKP